MSKNKRSALRHVTGAQDFDEHRKTARLDIPIKVHYKIARREGAEGKKGAKGAITKDVSQGGCLLLITEEIPLDSELELEIFLGKTQSESLKLKGRAVRINREERGLHEYGISFDSISPEARRLFADFCFTKMYEMIGLPQWPTDRKVK